MLSFSRSPIPGVAFLCAALTTAPAAAQTRYHVTRPPDELFAAYVRERQALNNQTNATVDLAHVLTHSTEYSPADVEWLLRELEQFALTGQPQWLRAEAVGQLALPGSNRAVRPTTGTFARLDRVYRRSSDPLVKTVVVSAMGTLTEEPRAISFLERVATHESGTFPSAGKALASLLVMGDEGRAVLKRLHDTGAVRDPKARKDLATLAKNGYRVPRGQRK
jgi:hypothetical protein